MADALDSGSSARKGVRVQVPSTAFSKIKGLGDLERQSELIEKLMSNKSLTKLFYR